MPAPGSRFCFGRPLSELLESPPEWVRAAPWEWIAALLVVAGAYVVFRLLSHKIGSQIDDAEKRHRYRKRVGYAIAVFVVVVLGIAFFEKIRELGTVLGFIGAGIAIALREYLASFLAWFYILSQRNIALGSRIEAGGVRGDVIDIGLFKLTLVEVRGEGLGDQSSGRLVTVPNYKILTDPVYHFTLGSPFVWDEIDFMVTFESDWERAKEIVEQVGREVTEPHRAEIDSGFRQIESAYAFRYGVTTPIVYTSIAASGITLRLRYLTHVRQRRNNRDAISRRVLELFGQTSGIEFAYPTSRVYRSEMDAERFEEKPPRPLP
ncbi:MAG TPA: mechanosensitive ion channel family protein [Gemmatimonadota bacterium]|nr:mechanosensitive ion channel family protein [Gemmatimonadota bacterium]